MFFEHVNFPGSEPGMYIDCQMSFHNHLVRQESLPHFTDDNVGTY